MFWQTKLLVLAFTLMGAKALPLLKDADYTDIDLIAEESHYDMNYGPVLAQTPGGFYDHRYAYDGSSSSSDKHFNKLNPAAAYNNYKGFPPAFHQQTFGYPSGINNYGHGFQSGFNYPHGFQLGHNHPHGFPHGHGHHDFDSHPHGGPPGHNKQPSHSFHQHESNKGSKNPKRPIENKPTAAPSIPQLTPVSEPAMPQARAPVSSTTSEDDLAYDIDIRFGDQ